MMNQNGDFTLEAKEEIFCSLRSDVSVVRHEICELKQLESLGCMSDDDVRQLVVCQEQIRLYKLLYAYLEGV